VGTDLANDNLGNRIEIAHHSSSRIRINHYKKYHVVVMVGNVKTNNLVHPPLLSLMLQWCPKSIIKQTKCSQDTTNPSVSSIFMIRSRSTPSSKEILHFAHCTRTTTVRLVPRLVVIGICELAVVLHQHPFALARLLHRRPRVIGRALRVLLHHLCGRLTDSSLVLRPSLWLGIIHSSPSIYIV